MVKTAGLRVDVDTLRGTRAGAPALARLLQQHNIKATFFFSVGPDNMGRNLWRLLRPSFLVKMLRSKAASLYGWDILLKGTFWPGPQIGRHAESAIRAVADAGHEIGFHAWDHWRWQRQLQTMSKQQIIDDMTTGINQLVHITEQSVHCAAAPAWMITKAGLDARDECKMKFSSDCRGYSVFKPQGQTTVQIPTTLPTYDELIGHNGVTNENYNHHLLGYFKINSLNILTIHAEVEGICCLNLFTDFLRLSRDAAITFTTLGEILKQTATIPTDAIKKKNISGRDGWLSWQTPLEQAI